MQSVVNDYRMVVLILAILGALVLYLLPAAKLLTRTVYRHKQFRHLRAAGKALLFLYRIRPRAIYRAACLWIEADLLEPRPTRPTNKVPEALQKYKDDSAEWTKRAAQRLGEVADESKQQSAAIKVSTCFQIYRAEEDIGRYFNARGKGSRFTDPKPKVFVSLVEVDEGFIAPLHFLGGLLSHFDEDWQPVINDYGRVLANSPDVVTKDIRGLQTYLFDCWLMWGPSIPIGTCTHWQGPKQLQFGYGDEGNSIALRHRDPGRLDPLALPTAVGGGHTTLAVQAKAVGRLIWAPAADSSDLCPVQQPKLNGTRDKLIFEAENVTAPRGGDLEVVSRQYYSAYIWVSFVLCDLEGHPLPGDPWRNMLTFFEHGNLAEEYTYEIMKKHLTRKAYATIERILTEEPDLSLRYGCATDDCGCGKPLAYPPPDGSSIKDMVQKESHEARLVLDPPVGAGDIYTAHGLPKLLQEYKSTS